MCCGLIQRDFFMDKIVSLMQDLHIRLDRLESSLEGIFDVEIPISETDSVYAVNIKCSIREAVKDDLTSCLKANKITRGQIFTTPTFITKNKWRIKELDLTKELEYRDTSNGFPCKLVVCKGRCTGIISSQSIDIALKFRKVEEQNEHFSEQEAINALHVDKNKNIRVLFPDLYCFARVVIQLPSGRRQLWECVGTELLKEVDNNLVTTKQSFYPDGFRLLQKMHSYGYIHGDAHRGNFMQRIRTNEIILIDQDEILPLSSNSTFSKFMQIMDYHMLMTWNNPFIGLYHDTEEIEHASSTAFRLFRFNETMSVLYPPVAGRDYLNWTHVDAKRLLDNDTVRHPKTKKTYWEFLNGITVADINKTFEQMFRSVRQMELFNINSKKILISQGVRVKIYSHEIVKEEGNNASTMEM